MYSYWNKRKDEIAIMWFNDFRCRLFSKEKWDQKSMSTRSSVQQSVKFERNPLMGEYANLFEARLVSIERF